MSGSENIKDVIAVTEVLQERALDRHRKNLAESKRLADELAQMDALREAAQQDTRSLEARRATGADTLWQTWMVTRRAMILQEMAMARAREGDSLSQARVAQARFDAALRIEEDARRERRERRLGAEAETIDALARLRLAGQDTAL